MLLVSWLTSEISWGVRSVQMVLVASSRYRLLVVIVVSVNVGLLRVGVVGCADQVLAGRQAQPEPGLLFGRQAKDGKWRQDDGREVARQLQRWAQIGRRPGAL